MQVIPIELPCTHMLWLPIPYIESAWKCVDGGAQIGNLLAKAIKDMGGEIFNYTEVNGFHFNDKKEITAVTSTDKYLRRQVLYFKYSSFQTLK
ncbi:MAG: hypothetical protein R2879_20730 [Saprospiraceae bacterium]